MSIEALSWAFNQRGITASEKLVLLAVANYANRFNECFMAQETLADDTELSARTVWSALNVLEGHGLIKRDKRNRGDGTRSTDWYTVHLDKFVVANSAKTTRNPRKNQSQQAQKPLAPIATQNLSNSNRKDLTLSSDEDNWVEAENCDFDEEAIGDEPPPKSQSQSIVVSVPVTRVEVLDALAFPPNAFEKWYADWPNKKGKEAGRKAFEKVRKARIVSFDELVEAVQIYIENKPKDRPWCHPATWLNEHRWLDEYNPGERHGPGNGNPSARGRYSEQNIRSGFQGLMGAANKFK